MQIEAQKLRTLNKRLGEENTLTKLDQMLARLPSNDPMSSPMRERREVFLRDMDSLLEGTIALLDEQEVVKNWIYGVNTCASTMDAANVVNPKYWQAGSRFSAVQSTLQEQAIKKGLRIRRIFLFDESRTNDLPVLIDLASQQSKIGVSVRFLSLQKAQTAPATLKSIADLGGTLDFVLFDISHVLLTYTGPNTHAITSGKLTRGRPVVDAAQQLYQELWSIATDSLQK